MKIIKIALCIIALAVLFMPSSSKSTPAPTPAPVKSNSLGESNQGVAYEFAKGFVEERLTAPSTAEFASHWDMKYEKVDTRTWKIWSYVDSQNALGATVRTKFYAKVMYLGPSSWKLLDIKLQ